MNKKKRSVRRSRLRRRLRHKYRRSGVNIRAVVFAGAVLVMLVLAAVLIFRIAARIRSKTAAETESSPMQETEEVMTASVIAVGDNLYHNNMIEAGASENGPWNYDFLYAHVLDEIQAADIAVVDQETVLTEDHDAVSAYPTFCTPAEAADALVKAGFDVVYSATNHADDKGPDAIRETVSYWRNHHPEITFLGLHDTPEDAESIRIREVNGIKVAFLNYTFGTNMAITEGVESYMIDRLSIGSEKVGEMIRKAKEQADCVIFIAHWGIEDEAMPTEYEKQWANFLMQQGVDVVIGGHPHVLQPYGSLSDDQGHETVIFYSLGNFVSNMNYLMEVVEGMASFTIEKTVSDGQVSVRILDQTVKPMVMHYDYNRENPAVYMLEDYTEELAQVHGSAAYMGEGIVSLRNMYRQFEEIMSMNVAPSTGTDLLNVHFDWDGNMLDPAGRPVKDGRSVSEYQYYGNLNVDISDYTSDEDIDYTPDRRG